MLELEIIDLIIRRGESTVVGKLNLKVTKGERVGVFGANGSGKTTLLDAICRQVHFSAGKIYWQGRPLANMSTVQVARLGVARSFQFPQILPNLTVLENLISANTPISKDGIFRALFFRSPPEAEPRSQAYLARCGLGIYARDLAGTLSFGQRRLLEIGCVLARRPQLVLLDEPSAGLSDEAKRHVSSAIGEMTMKRVPMIIVEHDLNFLAQHCDVIYQLEDGQLVKQQGY